MAKHKPYHYEGGKWRKRLRRAFAWTLVITLILLVIFLITWAILQPKKPKFTLQDATVYTFNVSSPNILTSIIQVTISARNPNTKMGVFYDNLHASATYQNQQITYFTSIPPTYQDNNEVDVWSPFISGTSVPIAPYNSLALSQDKVDGVVLLTIKIDGRVRFKVGSITSARYNIHVTCPAMITFGSRSTGIVVGNSVKYQLTQKCSVSV